MPTRDGAGGEPSDNTSTTVYDINVIADNYKKALDTSKKTGWLMFFVGLGLGYSIKKSRR